MAMLVLETEGRTSYQCACDRCGFAGEPSSSTTEASEGFQENPPGHYLCSSCFGLGMLDPTVEQQEQFDRSLRAGFEGHLRNIAPDVDTGPGTVVQSMIEEFVHRGALDRERLRMQMELPLIRRLAPAQLAQQFFPIQPLPEPAAMLAPYASADAAMSMALALDKVVTDLAPPLLPDWCREGQLVRRREDGGVLRIRTVGTHRMCLTGPHLIGPRDGSAWYDASNFEKDFEPIEAKTRWELLMEEDELVGIG